MAKTAKRLLILALTVLLVVAFGVAGIAMAAEATDEPVCYLQGDVSPDGSITKNDAIYLLYASIPMFAEDYPLNQDGDFQKDGVLNKDDAIYLLYASIPMFAEDYPLAGTIHTYHSPVWSWDEANNAATVTFKCGCGQEHVQQATVSKNVTSSATCTAAGSIQLSATLTFDGEEYTATKTLTIPASGQHQLVGTQDCENGVSCQLCDYTLPALGHNWAKVGGTPATCTSHAVETYHCTTCYATKDVELEGVMDHTYVQLAEDAQLSSCQFAKQFACKDCGAKKPVAEEDKYYSHNYTAQLTKEVTCTENGVKTYTCTCGASYTEGIAADGVSHAWVVSSEDAGKIVYACQCGQTKTEVKATDDGKVSTGDLTEDVGVALKDNTSVSMDQATLDDLDDREIQISVQTKPVDELDIPADRKEQIGENPVYDFSMIYTDTNEPISNFGGEITVRLPYDLGDDDIDSIDVWFINDQGEVESKEGKYSNGFVEFTTTHFSYYTVTRLTAQERCARWGHILVDSSRQANCTAGGYSMSVCQRCGETFNKVEFPATGHSYEETVTAATCGKAGTVTKVCVNCRHTVVGEVPALAHDMVVDETQSVAATCSAAGKTVSVCSRPDCGHTVEEAIAQLSHNYVPTESVKATCSAGGYDLFKCTLCGDEQKKNETAPKGHLYLEKDVIWTWTKDLSGATVTLVCANDKTHTKELTAVVTLDTKLSGAPTCTKGGTSVYSAAASFNNVTYTDINQVAAPALGHQPGSELQSNASSHYYTCGACGEKVDSVAHNWNDGTVTVAPTCGEKGKKTVSCTACGYEKEMSMPATGAHSYVNGVCSVCGFDGNNCNHNKVTRTELDLSGYDLCEGTKIYIYSCECGENKYLDYDRLGCQIDEPKEEKVPNEAGGYDYYLYGSCSECSLSVCQKQITTLVEGECASSMQVTMEMYAGDVLLGAARFYDETRSHPGVTTLETVDLSTFGLCGGTVVTKQCPCGEFTKISYESKCQWEYADSTEDGGEGYHCYVCGAERITYWDYVEEGCYTVELGTYDFYKGGEKVYTCTTSYVYENHSYKITDYEMYGESCEDGILAKGACTECGKETEEYVDYHVSIVEKQIIDLSDKGICLKGFEIMTCPCDEEWTEYYEIGECEWSHYWDDATGRDYARCDICGVTKRFETVYDGEKNEYCEVVGRNIATYTDKGGNVIAQVYDSVQEVDHDMKQEATLLGESCEDGVIIREYCADCAHEWEEEYNWHYNIELESYDLSDWGTCFTEVVLRGCACGREIGMETYGGRCNWRMIDADGGEEGYYEIYQCTSCGLMREESVKFAQGEDACHRISHITYTYSLEGKEPITISYDRVEENHDVERSFKLQEGATSCEEGVQITEICRNCGYTDSQVVHYHETFETVQENVDGGKLCGSVDLIINSCACGLGSDTYLKWTGEDRCSFSGNYNEEEKCWIFTCHKCGAYYKEISKTVPNEDDPCRYEEYHQFTYYAADGTELFSYASSGWYARHAYVYTYKLIGETCDDGYYMTRYCQRCGYTNDWQDVYTGCETRAVERDVVYSSEDICGDIELVRYACACGAEGYYSVDSRCSWSWAGWSEDLGGEIYECRICGLQRVYNSEEQRIPGTCKVTRTMHYTFLLDGEVVGDVEKTYEQTQHMTVNVKNLLGETCEEGWTVTVKCIYCDYGYTNDDVQYGHSNCRLAVYDMAQYGMCGGYVEIHGCGCGEEEWISNNGVLCNWQHQGGVDGADGNIYYCEGCGTQKTEIYTNEIIKEECRRYSSTTVTYTREGETVLEFSISYYDDYHEYLYIGGELNGATCNDGYTAYLQCAACGETSISAGSMHDTHVAEYIDLDALGSSCGGKLGVATCVCGLRKELDDESNCNTWYGSHLGSTGDERNGTSLRKEHCPDCGIEVIYDNSWSTADDACITYTAGTATIILGDYTREVPLAQISTDRHIYGDTVYTLEPGSANCDDGVIATRICTLCGETETWRSRGHAMMVVDRFDMTAMGAECGGYIRVMSCACGECTNWDIEETDCNWSWSHEYDYGDDRNGSSRMRYECDDCGFVMLMDTQWTTPDASCQTESNVRVYAEDGNGQEFTFCRYYASHLLETYCELRPGSVTCEDGIIGTDRCKFCDYVQTWGSSGHAQMVIDRIDLAAMGSSCGGEIRVLNCACGANPGWNRDYMNCELGYWTNVSYSGDVRNGKRVDTVTCDDCGLVLTEETTFTTPDDSC